MSTSVSSPPIVLSHRRRSSPTVKTNIIETLGPVDNLESYVKADWWRHLFNANYLRTDGDVVGDPEITAKEISGFLSILNLQTDAAVLDLCCGQGRHVLELARRGFPHVTGLDRSHYLVNRARALARKEELNAVFKEGDARKLSFPSQRFDAVIIAGNSFGYFESASDDHAVLTEVMRVLRPNGKLLIDITDGDFMRRRFEPRSWEWIDKNYFVCRERCLSSDGERLVSREVITHVTKGVVADQFYAERLYTHCEISQLLRTAGFTEVRCHEEILTESKRNQDLGMMARRLVFEAQTPPAPQQLLETAKMNVTVLLGDPRRTDVVKPNGSFDEDDFKTITALKEALAQNDTHEFVFVDDHATLLREIHQIGQQSDLVLNLCDEGFDNNATKELHVPALLEMAGIPYTGGSPQCLAYCYDKSLVRGVASEMDIPVPQAYLIKADDTNFIELTLNFPVIIKPNFGDSSFGITAESVCYNVKQMEHAIMRARDQFGYEKPVLVEEFLTGKDITVGIIGNPPGSYLELPIIEEDYSSLPPNLPHLCGYEAKWDPESPYWQLTSAPANLPPETEGFLRASCIKLFERLECRDYARFDWRLDANGTPRLLEVNPNPGWCWDGHLAKMCQHTGIAYSQMLAKILAAAQERLSL